MRKSIRILVVAMLGTALTATAWAAPRGKGSSIGFHKISDTSSGDAKEIKLADGSSGYVLRKPVGTAMDIVSATSIGDGVEIRLSGAATRRLSSDGGEVAVLINGVLASTGTMEQDGRLVVSDLSPDHSARLLDTASGQRAAYKEGGTISAVYAGREGDAYLVDIFAQNVKDLRSYQFVLVSGGADAGQLELSDVRIDASRADYAFGDAQTVEANSPHTGLLANVLYDGSVDAIKPLYLGTYVFQASADAAGTFRINIDTGRESLIGNARNEAMPFNIGPDALIPMGSPRTRDSK